MTIVRMLWVVCFACTSFRGTEARFYQRSQALQARVTAGPVRREVHELLAPCLRWLGVTGVILEVVKGRGSVALGALQAGLARVSGICQGSNGLSVVGNLVPDTLEHLAFEDAAGRDDTVQDQWGDFDGRMDLLAGLCGSQPEVG